MFDRLKFFTLLLDMLLFYFSTIKSLLGFSDLTGMPVSQMRLFHLNFAFFSAP